jgi:hypothetical protein
MSSNAIPTTYEPLIQLLTDAVDGSSTHGAAVGLKQNDEPALRAVLHDLVGTPAGPDGQTQALPGLKAQYNTAKANKAALTAALRSAQSNGRALAMACIGTLKPRLGNKWNAAWQEAGFAANSLQVPVNPVFVLQHLHSFYLAHADYEVKGLTPDISCTASACAGAVQAIADAQVASNRSNFDTGEARNRLEQGVKAARMRLSGLREELVRLIADDDHRWYAFGFDRPSHVGSPETPENVAVTPGAAGSGLVFVDWDDARRADSYRLRATDADGNVLAEVLPQDSEAKLTGLPAGSTVALTVTARNAAGESPASDAVEVDVP